jgi:hypothetical protein
MQDREMKFLLPLQADVLAFKASPRPPRLGPRSLPKSPQIPIISHESRHKITSPARHEEPLLRYTACSLVRVRIFENWWVRAGVACSGRPGELGLREAAHVTG